MRYRVGAAPGMGTAGNVQFTRGFFNRAPLGSYLSGRESDGYRYPLWTSLSGWRSRRSPGAGPGFGALGAPVLDSAGNIIGDDGSAAVGYNPATWTPTDQTGGAATSGASAGGWLTQLITGITQYKVGQQQLDAIAQVNQINIQRAAAGLPPIPMPTLGQPGVNVGLSPDVQNLLIYGGLGVGALWLLTSFMKRR